MQLEGVSRWITQKLERMIEAADPNLILCRHKAISALFPYVVYLAQDGQQGMADMFVQVTPVRDVR